MAVVTSKARVGGLTAILCSLQCVALAAGIPHAAAQEVPPAPAADAAPQEQAVEADAEQESEQRIDVMEYRIDGNTVLSALDIEAAVEPFLGPQRTVADIQSARDALEKAYRSKGYETVGVEIPEQDVRTGIVRFNVVELRVGQLRVTGARYYSPERIKANMPSLAEGNVPRYDQVSREIAEVNNSRDRTITPALRAGTEPGTVDVDLEVEDRSPLHGSFELNDRYTTQTSRLRAVASLSYANLFQRDHNLNLQAQVAPEDLSEMYVVSASYLAPINKEFSVVAYAVRSDSDVAAVGGIDVLGKGDIFGLRLVKVLPGGDNLSHQLIAGFDYKKFKEDLVLGADTASTPISYAPLSLGYSAGLSGKTGITEGSVTLTWGTRGFGADNDEFAFKRYGAKANFFYVRTDLKRTQTLPHDMRLTAVFSGQLADQPLISNEGFSIGGQDSVRGYEESQTVGDYGLQASLQLDSPSLAATVGKPVDEWRFFVFGDWGRVYIRQALADVDGSVRDRIELASLGLGTRLRMFERANAMVYLAAPLHDKEALDLDYGDRYRAGFRLWTEF